MGESNSKQKKDVAFNRLPDLVKQWDKTQQENINKFQESLIYKSAGFNKKAMIRQPSEVQRPVDYDVKLSHDDRDPTIPVGSSGGMIKDYLSNVFDSSVRETDGADEEKEMQFEKQKPLLKNGGGTIPRGYSTNSPNQSKTIPQHTLFTPQVSEDFSINDGERKDEDYIDDDDDDEEAGLTRGRMKNPHLQLSFQEKLMTFPHTEAELSHNHHTSSLETREQVDLQKQRKELKKYIMKSIIEEEINSNDKDQKNNYKLIYKSNIKNVSGYGVVPADQNQGRTESFQENLDFTEFKKEQKKLKKLHQKLSTTQKLFNRKDLFQWGKKKDNKRPTVVNRQSLKKEDALKDEIYQLRKQELQQKAQERKQKLDQDNFLKINRDQMITQVCQIIFKHIEAAEKYIEEPTQAAMLFHEHNFIGHEWHVQTTSGYSSTMPLFLYVLEELEYNEKACAEGDLILFMRKIFEKMQLATECIIVTLIYLEKVMLKGGIEMRYCNWKPLLFTGILLASKFWEDINFWNVDYVDALGLYPLKSINRMESEFVSLCDYNLFVSADLYTQYYLAIKEAYNEIYSAQQQVQKPFNRFKTNDIAQPSQQRFQKLENREDASLKEDKKLPRQSSPSTIDTAKKANLPVFYHRQESNNNEVKQPHYPAVKVNVSKYQQEVADIMEESVEEEERQRLSIAERKTSKIKKILNSPSRTNNSQTIIQQEDLKQQMNPQVPQDEVQALKIDISETDNNHSIDFNINKSSYPKQSSEEEFRHIV